MLKAYAGETSSKLACRTREDEANNPAMYKKIYSFWPCLTTFLGCHFLWEWGPYSTSTHNVTLVAAYLSVLGKENIHKN